eukprot:jgi/Psemu1/26116/gm1.26116_g
MATLPKQFAAFQAIQALGQVNQELLKYGDSGSLTIPRGKHHPAQLSLVEMMSSGHQAHTSQPQQLTVVRFPINVHIKDIIMYSPELKNMQSWDQSWRFPVALLACGHKYIFLMYGFHFNYTNANLVKQSIQTFKNHFIAILSAQECGSRDKHGTLGYYIRSALQHYMDRMCIGADTKPVQVLNTVEFFPYCCKMLTTSSADKLVMTLQDIRDTPSPLLQ